MTPCICDYCSRDAPVVAELIAEVADLANKYLFMMTELQSLQQQIGTINATIGLLNQNQQLQSDRITNVSRYLRSESPN